MAAYDERHRQRVLSNFQGRAKTLGVALAPIPEASAVSYAGHRILHEPNAMRLRFIVEHGRECSANRLCQVLDVSERGRRADRSHLTSQRQRTHMIVLASH